MAMVSADGSSQSFGGLTAQIGWFGLRVGGHPALSLHSSNEPGEFSQWLCHDDSTINIVVVIIIIIIIAYIYTILYLFLVFCCFQQVHDRFSASVMVLISLTHINAFSLVILFFQLICNIICDIHNSKASNSLDVLWSLSRFWRHTVLHFKLYS